MELEQIIEGLADYGELVKNIQATRDASPWNEIKDQYDPLKHAVMNRPPKQVKTDTGERTEERAKLPVPLQELIVEYAVQMCVGNPIEYQATPTDANGKDMYEIVKAVVKKNRLAMLDKQIMRHMKSETEAAELWFSEEAPDGYWAGTPNDGTGFKLRVRILSPSLGDTLVPVFNRIGDMVAFGRGYTEKTGSGVIEHFDIYTDTTTYFGVKGSDAWAFEQKPSQWGKIPVIYHSQGYSEWRNVQRLIERVEMSMSKHADNNDYYAFPIMTSTGKIKSFADKGEDGKILELEDNAKLEMLTWPQAPESVKLEQTTLHDAIFLSTMTPRLTEEQVKGLGNYSGVALKMLFLPAHMKAAKTEEIFGPGVARRINLIKAWAITNKPALAPAAGLEITPVFTYFTPKNELEEVQILTSAVSGERPIMTQEAAVKQNPLVQDGEAEWEKMQAEQTAQDSSPSGLDRSLRAVI